MALKRIEGKSDIDLIHHSDRGCQYASREYVGILKSHGIRISMTENGYPKENAQAERINNTIKNELFKDMVFSNIKEVKAAVRLAVNFYNNERPHMSINMIIPAEASKCEGELKKLWTSWRAIAIKSRQDALDIPDNGLPLQPLTGITTWW